MCNEKPLKGFTLEKSESNLYFKMNQAAVWGLDCRGEGQE